MYLRIARICKNVQNDPAKQEYTDQALAPTDNNTKKDLKMFKLAKEAK